MTSLGTTAKNWSVVKARVTVESSRDLARHVDTRFYLLDSLETTHNSLKVYGAPLTGSKPMYLTPVRRPPVLKSGEPRKG